MTSPGQPPVGAPRARAATVPRVWPFKRVYYGWAIVVAASFASFGEVPVFGPILGLFVKPLQEELGWSAATIALGFTIGSISGSIASIVVGRVVDRYGARVVVCIGGVLITSALLGLATVNEPWQFWALFGLGRGAAIAGVEIGTSVAIAKWFYRRRARTLALKGMGQRTGQAIMPLIIFAVMSASGWRAAYVAMAGISAFAIVLPSVVLLRRQPEDMGLAPDGAPLTHATTGARALPGSVRNTDVEVSWTLAEARRTKAFWLLIAYGMGTPFVQGATNLYMVANFQDRGLSDGAAVSILTIFATISTLSMFPVSLALEHVHVRHGAMVMAAMLVGAMAVITVADSYGGALLFALLFGVAAGMRNIIETLLVANYYGRKSLGAIKGFGAPFRLVSPLGPLFAGFMRDTTGNYTGAFATFGVVAVLMFLAVAFATPPSKGQGN